MNNQPIIFERIIRGNLRPWLDCNEHEEKFARIINDLKQIECGFEPLYEIDFYRCFNCKTKLYHQLIIIEADHYCNRVIELIKAHEDIRVKKYLLNGRLKKVKILLGESARLIDTNCFELQIIDPYKSDFDEGQDHKAGTFVIQLLKTALLKVYLEIQEVFRYFILDEDYMEIEDLYLQVLFETIPEQTFLKRRDLETRHCLVSKDSDERDMKPAYTGPKSFKFDWLATNPGALNDLFDSLLLLLFIAKGSSVRDFKRVFSGIEILNPIRWTGTSSEFYWFIYLIYTKYKFVEDLRQQQWKVACHCFVKADGTRFDQSKIRNLKKPRLTGAVLEKAVRLLK